MTAQLKARTATAHDVPRIVALLQASELPTSDIEDCRPNFVLIEDGAELLATAGVQQFGDVALLRSVAVRRDRQRDGLGSGLLSQLEQHAIALGIRELILLTQTAERFFARQGYSRVERAGVPEVIRATTEFRLLCPASAVCMSKRLTRS